MFTCTIQPVATCEAMNRSERIRHGIAVARERGVEWGRCGKALAAKNATAANEHSECLRPLVASLFSIGVLSPTDIARVFNRMGVPSHRGVRWSRSTAWRLIRRLGPSLRYDAVAALKSKIGEPLKERVSYQEWCALSAEVKP